MAEFNKIRFFLFVSLMIFSAHALDVILSRAQEHFKQKSEIKINITNGQKIYDGTLNELTYQANRGTRKVIVYIIGRNRFVEIIRNSVRRNRLSIAMQLNERHHELVFLGIENFDDDEYSLIGAFMGDKLRRHPSQTDFTIETIGENHFDQFYQSNGQNLAKYEENAYICEGNLLARLRSITHGALNPVESDEKEIRSYDYAPYLREEKWAVTVENGTYIPVVDVSDSRYNFKLRYLNMDIHLVILSGKEYLAVTITDASSQQVTAARRVLRSMFSMDNEAVIILGAFNFDWTEIDILTQIILCHTWIEQDSNHNVYTHGLGMFNTIYLNMKNDGRFLLKHPNFNIVTVMRLLIAKEVKERFIDVYYADNGWQHLTVSITSANGRYLREATFNFSFPWTNQNIAFIVHESAGTINAIVQSRLWRPVNELKRSGINVVVIKTTNFEWYDAHIIAEWIDLHKGNVYSEQIAVLGGGIFDTLFQSPTTTYSTLFHYKKNELKRIRNTFVNSGNGKRVLAAKIDDSRNFDVWSYPMNTVNGFYEPDLIPDTNMFCTGIVRKIFFIITSANYFHRISAVENVGSVVSEFRKDINHYYPIGAWSVFLVCFENFEERDSHLFVELVKMQIKGAKYLKKFVRTFNYGISQAKYHYKDNVPLTRETRPEMFALVSAFFEKILTNDG